MSGVKKFIIATEKFLERASLLIDAAAQKEELGAKEMVDYLDVIYRGLQSIKLMSEDKKKNRQQAPDSEPVRSLAERMSKNSA